MQGQDRNGGTLQGQDRNGGTLQGQDRNGGTLQGQDRNGGTLQRQDRNVLHPFHGQICLVYNKNGALVSYCTHSR